MAEVVIWVDTNASGSGSASLDALIFGELAGVRIVHVASPETTTDIVLSETNGLKRTFLTRTSDAVSASYNPQNQMHDADGKEVNKAFSPFKLSGSKLKATVTDGVASQSKAVGVRVLTF
jgi:hypothetical protein